MRREIVTVLVMLSIVFAEKYAIVMQGDEGYDNYSDSSNTCRGYNDLVASGMDPDHIIYMANEETLVNRRNPWKGMLFTIPDPSGEGWDHAKDCKEHYDYTNEMITPDIVMAIIEQDEETVKKLTGLEHPKVFHTTEEDTLFIYYSDHGYDGGVGCKDSFIPGSRIRDALKSLHERKAYKYMAFFLEACESGSVFEALPDNLNIYAFTSANPVRLAMCDYCPPNDVVNGKAIGTCLSMLYDNSFQKHWEDESTTITLNELWKKVHDEVAEHSHQEVSQWGDLKMGELPMTTFIGNKKIVVNRASVERKENTRVRMDEVALHEAKWRAIRAAANDDSAVKNLEAVIMENAKKEITVMRLGASVLGEQKMNEMKDRRISSYKATCASSLFEGLIQHCLYTLPFTESASNIVHAICEGSFDVELNWDAICM